MEKRKPEKKPCPSCGKPLAPQGVALHFARKHPGEEPPKPESAPPAAESAPKSAPPAKSAPKSAGDGILSGEGGILS